MLLTDVELVGREKKCREIPSLFTQNSRNEKRFLENYYVIVLENGNMSIIVIEFLK